MFGDIEARVCEQLAQCRYVIAVTLRVVSFSVIFCFTAGTADVDV